MDTHNEQHYLVKDLADKWNLSQKVVRELFAGEAGVLRIARPRSRSKREYCSLRIPESVARRVHDRLRGATK